MLSRHADCAFWIGRYIERAEATARMIDVHYHFGLESPLVGRALTWEAILAISGQKKKFNLRYQEINERNILHFFAFDQKRRKFILYVFRAYFRRSAKNGIYQTHVKLLHSNKRRVNP